MNDDFKIALTPIFDFNKEALQKAINKIEIPKISIPIEFDTKQIKLGSNLDLANFIDFKKTAKSINRELSNLKLKKINIDININAKSIENELEKAVKSIDLSKIEKTISSKGNKRGIFYGLLDIPSEQAALYKELLKQEKLLDNLKKQKDKGFVGNEQEYLNIIQCQEKIIDNIKGTIENENLVNKKIVERKDLLQDIQRLADIDKEKKRTAKLGKEVDIGKSGLSFDSGYEDIENFLKQFSGKDGSFEKITSMTTKVQDLHNAQKQFTATFKSGTGFVTEYTYSIDKATNKVYELGEKVKRTTTSIAGFGGYFTEMIKKVTEWNLAVQLVSRAGDFLKQGANFIINLDEQLTAVALVSGKTREQVESLKDSFISFARETKQTVSEISKLNIELTRQGLTVQETNDRMSTILKLSSVAGLDTESTLRTITSSVNALGETAQRTADILVYADNNSASSVDSIGKALARVSAIAKGTGFSIEQTTAIISTLIDVTQEAPETLGNALKSIFARFSKVNELGEINKDINDVARAYKAAGIEFTDFTGQIRDKFTLLSELANKWKVLDDKTRAYIATLVAGSLQQNRFLVLMQNWDRVSTMFENLENFSEGSLEKGFETWSGSLTAQINNLKISVEELWTNLLNEEIVGKFISFLDSVVFLFNKINRLIPVFNLGLSGLVFALGKKFSKNKNRSYDEAVINFAKNIIKLLPKLKNLVSLLNKESIAAKNASRSQKEHGNSVDNTTKKINVANKSIKAMIVSSKVLQGVLSFGLTTLFTTVISGLTDLISNNSLGESFEDFSDKFKDLSINFKEQIATLKGLKNEYEVLSKIVGKNTDVSKLNNEEKQRFVEINEQIAEIAPEFISYWDDELGAMIKYGTKIEDIINLKKELYLIDKKFLRADLDKSSKEQSKKLQDYITEMQDAMDKINGTSVTNQNVIDRGYIGYAQQLALEKEKLQKEGLTESEYLKIKKNIDSLELKMSKATSIITKTKKEINYLIGGYKELLDIDINDYLKNMNLSLPTNLKQIILENSNKILEEQALKMPKNLAKAFDITDLLSLNLIETSEKIRKILKDSTPYDISDNIDDLSALEEQLVQLGISSDIASNFITDFALSISGLNNIDKEATEPIILLEKQIAGLSEQITNFKNIYDKAVKGNLSFSESFKFLNEQESVIDKVNEGMSVQNAIRETALELIDQTNVELEKNLVLTQEDLQNRKVVLQNTIESQKKNLEGLKNLGKENTIQYKSLSEELSANEKALKNVDDQISSGMKKLQAYKSIIKDSISKEQAQEVSEQFKKATDNVIKFKTMIDTINNEGITSSIMTDIINNFPDLIDYLDNEIALKEQLNNLLKDEENLQKNSYRLKIMYSENFANAFMKTNANMINDLSKKYGVDLNNFATLQTKKMALLDSMSKSISKYNDSFSGSLGNMTNAEITNQINVARNELSQLQSQLKQNASSSLLMDQISIKQQEIITLQDALKFSDKIDSSVDKLFDKVDFNKINDTTKSKASSSAKEKQKKYLEFIDLQNDKYLKLNKQLEENNRLKDKNNQLLGYASGQMQVELIQKENKLLTDRQKLLHQLANQYREEQKELEKQLSSVIKLDAGDYGLDSYSKFITTKEKEINNLISKINATTNENMVNSLTEKKDVLQKKVNEISESYKRYVEIIYNSIPSLQDEYGQITFQKLDNTLKIITEKIQKFNIDINRLNIFKDIKITKKEDTIEDLNKQLHLQKEIFNLYEKQLSVAEQEVQKNKENVRILETKLSGIKDKNSSEYKNMQESLIQAKKLSNEVIATYETVIQSYTDSLNNRINVELQILDKIRDNVKKSITDLRKEKDNFSLDDFVNTIQTIENAINRIDKNFISNPTTILDTTNTRDTLDKVLNDIVEIRKNTDRWKNSIEQVTKSNKSNKQIIEDVKKITSQMVVAENKLTEEIEKRRKENNELKLEYEKIEDSLQNLIDVKQKEIDKYKEELEHNQKVNSLIEARLNLLKAMDDTSYEYITGTGEVEWTYNKSQVNENLKQLANLLNQNVNDEKLNKMELELKEMVEKLETTKKIHQQNLEINTAQLNQLEKERDYISNLVDKSLETIDKNFEKVSNDYIAEMDTLLKKNTNVLIDIYDLLRQNIGSNFKYSGLRNNNNLSEKYNIKENVLQTLQEKLSNTNYNGYNLDTFRLNNNLREVPTLNGIGSSNLVSNNSNVNDTNITIHSINLDNINNGKEFINYLQNVARNGISRLN